MAKGDKLVEKAGWLLGISGLLMVLFGLVLFFTPVLTIETAVLIIGAVLTVVGVLKLCEALFFGHNARYAGVLAASGAVSLIVGMVMLFGSPFVTGGVIFAFGALAALLGLLALVSGAGHIAYALKAKKGKTWGVVLGLILVLLGLVVLFNLFGSAMALLMLLAVFMIVYGVVLAIIAMNIKEIMA